MWSRVSIPRQGKGMWLLHPVPHVESKKRRSIEFMHLIIVTVDFHCHVIFTCEHTYILRGVWGEEKHVNVKVEPRSTFRFTWAFHIASISFTCLSAFPEFKN